MKYVAPYGSSDPNAPYVNGNPSTGQAGSIPPAAAFEHPLRELVALITASGQTPDETKLTQVAMAIISGKLTSATATGSANSWIITLPLAPYAYAFGLHLDLVPPATNTSATVVANVNGLGSKPVKKRDGTNPAVGDIVGGIPYPTFYDGTNIRILTPLPSEFIGQRGRSVFTANGTLVMLSSLVKLMSWGGAAGGGGVNASGGAGGGGGGGEYREGFFSVVQGSSHAVTIGVGGPGGTTAGTNGSNGGSTSVGSLITAAGGLFGAGASGTYGAGGLGGSGGSGGDFAQNGGNGSNGGNLGANVSSGTGGGSWMVTNHYIQFTAGAGGNGLFFGQGGNGATGGGGAAAGGNGKPGLVIAEFY